MIKVKRVERSAVFSIDYKYYLLWDSVKFNQYGLIAVPLTQSIILEPCGFYYYTMENADARLVKNTREWEFTTGTRVRLTSGTPVSVPFNSFLEARKFLIKWAKAELQNRILAASSCGEV